MLFKSTAHQIRYSGVHTEASQALNKLHDVLTRVEQSIRLQNAAREDIYDLDDATFTLLACQSTLEMAAEKYRARIDDIEDDAEREKALNEYDQFMTTQG